jgi:uncharacterized membrane protein YraQ (UPF0718 family)
MRLNIFAPKDKDVCEIHGAHGKSGNRMLIGMILASLILMAWHVWMYGPVGHIAPADGDRASLPVLLGNELWDVIFNKKGILRELWEVFPYFIAGILIAGYLRTYKIAVKLQSSLRKYGVASVFLASFVGIITPLCACGTLTTAISLLFAGIPLAPVMALMVTSPLLSPTTYLITLNDLGPEWTVIRTVSAFSMGIFAGLITHYLSKREGFGKKDIFIEGAMIRGDFHDEDYPDERLRCNCRRNFGNRVAIRTGNNFLVFLAKSAEMLWGVGKYILVGVTVGAVVERYMPSEWVYHLFGQKGPLSIVWVTLASVPMFLHQISASSIIYHIKGSLAGTLDNGAALAFMIGGPVTAVPTMVLFWTFFKKRVFLLYMFICLSGTLLIAYTCQFLLFVPGVDLGNPLLKGVSSLSGGRTVAIRKIAPQVRMVMDQGGTGGIAVFSNEAEGRGGVVFDAAADRFATDRYDNRKYVANIAEWLDQQSIAGKKDILVYTDGMQEPPLIDVKIVEALKEKGFTLRIAGRKEIPRLTGELLDNYGQLWLFVAGEGLSDAELQLIDRENAKGRGTMIAPVAKPDAGMDIEALNRLSSRFGVRFSGISQMPQELHVSAGANLFDRASELIGRFLKLVKKA